MKARFTVEREEPKAVFIVDQCELYQCMSVTNDAENVVEHLWQNYGDKQFFYKDTTGQWDELTHKRGVFQGFKYGVELA